MYEKRKKERNAKNIKEKTEKDVNVAWKDR